jgi:hypothetical protein
MLRHRKRLRALTMIPATLVGIAGLVWLVRGVDSGHGFQIATGSYTVALAIGIAALVLLPSRASNVESHQVVGGLADVLAALGEELGDAEGRARDRSTIAWSGAELELSVTMQQAGKAGIAFNVVNGEITEGNSQTSSLKINIWPVREMPDVGR